jgi:hypothetical protein
MYIRKMALTILSLLFLSSPLLAQDTSASPLLAQDTSTSFYILETFDEDLNRSQQLEVLDKALGEKFNLAYELKVKLQNMGEREKKYLQKYIYLKARKPMPISSDDPTMTNYNITNTFNELDRGQQLDVLENAQGGKKFDLKAELVLIMENMKEEDLDGLLKYVFAKANKPLELKGKAPAAKVQWTEVEHHFGAVKRGGVVTYAFDFRNVGKVPYQIEKVDASCGCTVASYTEGVIEKYQTGKVIVTFDSTNKPVGENTELITVKGNSYPEKVVLLININVY